ncbi:MAG: hypothetical protein R2722_06780 [Tessaracoccus sp.]
MAVPTPLFHNHALWEVLKLGPESRYGRWFDIDLTGSREILMPVLGRRIGQELEDGAITLEEWSVPRPDGSRAKEPVVVYADHVFPVRPGTDHLPSLNSWSGSTTAWPIGRWAARNSTTAASSTSTRWPRSVWRMTTSSKPRTGCWQTCTPKA